MRDLTFFKGSVSPSSQVVSLSSLITTLVARTLGRSSSSSASLLPFGDRELALLAAANGIVCVASLLAAVAYVFNLANLDRRVKARKDHIDKVLVSLSYSSFVVTRRFFFSCGTCRRHRQG